LIGLLDSKTESFRRFEEYFGWKFPSPVSQTCKNNMYYFEWISQNPHPVPESDDSVVSLIRIMNKFDVALYEYAKQLFEEQSALFWEIEDQQPLYTWKSDKSEQLDKREKIDNEV